MHVCYAFHNGSIFCANQNRLKFSTTAFCCVALLRGKVTVILMYLIRSLHNLKGFLNLKNQQKISSLKI